MSRLRVCWVEAVGSLMTPTHRRPPRVSPELNGGPAGVAATWPPRVIHLGSWDQTLPEPLSVPGPGPGVVGTEMDKHRMAPAPWGFAPSRGGRQPPTQVTKTRH